MGYIVTQILLATTLCSAPRQTIASISVISRQSDLVRDQGNVDTSAQASAEAGFIGYNSKLGNLVDPAAVLIETMT